MIHRLRNIFARYATRHLQVDWPGFNLIGGDGVQIGHVDLLRVRQGRLCVIGWTTGQNVSLKSDTSFVTTRPVIERGDVAAAMGTPSAVGFELDVPFSLAPMVLSVRTDIDHFHHLLPPLPKNRLRRARGWLALRFLGTLVRLSPAILVWLVTRSHRAHAAVKAGLDLDVTSPAMALDERLLSSAERRELPKATPITIILPVYNALDLLPEVLQRVERNTDLPFQLVIVEDCSSDDAVRPFLQKWVAATDCDVRLIENPRNLGFIGSVNTAFKIAIAAGHHTVILNSDAFVPPGWATRLIRPILEDDDVATTTPMSNDAEILSVPVITQRSTLGTGDADAIDAVASALGSDLSAEVPTGVGFCMAMNIAHLRRHPEFDTAFGRGYGEEVDWCQRAALGGGKHRAVPNLFVEHRGGESFGAAKARLVAANNQIVSGRYPDYDRRVQDFIHSDPLLTARLALGMAWAARRAKRPVDIFLAHSLGGGAEAYLGRRIAATLKEDGVAVVLRVGGRQRWQVELHCPKGIVMGTTDSFDLVQRMLAPLDRRNIVYSCGVGDAQAPTLPDCLTRLARHDTDTIEVLFHDFFPISPSYCLLDQKGGFRGPVTADNADPGHVFLGADGAETAIATWQRNWGKLIGAADKLVVFSRSSRDLVLASYPQARSALQISPHPPLVELDPLSPPPATGPTVIGVLGGLSYHKGAGVLTRFAAGLDRNASIVVIGNVDPAYPMPAKVRIHGDYDRGDIVRLARQYGIGIWLIPSIWPETFSFTTHEALATGLPVYCFDLGAQAEAAHAAPNGHVVDFSPDEDNAASLTARLKTDGILGGAAADDASDLDGRSPETG